VGPVWKGGSHGEADLLASCYHAAFRLAREKGARSLSFPCISTGVYGYPAEEAAAVAVGAVLEELAQGGVDRALLVAFDAASRRTLESALKQALSPETGRQNNERSSTGVPK
jgi:O-acetyl-ADP-ribose deacetylase (regulator of RNase III)